MFCIAKYIVNIIFMKLYIQKISRIDSQSSHHLLNHLQEVVSACRLEPHLLVITYTNVVTELALMLFMLVSNISSDSNVMESKVILIR